MPNRLVHETSPYLLQHAHNPVDWYPWGEEALRRAREEAKPIFLSIGYAACHWCHVMERESFEDEGIARLLKEGFVSIKVDREERPDLDSIYMEAVQAMTGHGGWPLSVFLTPEGKPFFGGTYFPPADRPGLPGFPRVLQAVLEAYHSRRVQVIQTSEGVLRELQQASGARSQPGVLLGKPLLAQAFSRLSGVFDRENGGLSAAPKFPQPMLIEFLLHYHKTTGDTDARRMAEQTLEHMARGGIYDHLAGGFHRYSTDARWLVPHFEKMLYDNALLARTYLHAYQLTGRAEFRRVVEETLDFLLGEMRDPAGGLCSSMDADSEGEEGRYYVWTAEEVLSALGPEEGPAFNQAYGVGLSGNFEGGRAVLSRVLGAEELAATRRDGPSVEESEGSLARSREALRAARARRVPPGRDAKVLTAWNGLALRALAEAGAVLDRADYREAAVRLGAFLTSALRREDGRLLRTYRDGQARIPAYLEDYAFLAEGLLGLYEAVFERHWLDEARALADALLDLFWAPVEGTFYDTGKDAEALVLRPRTILDNALPCGASVATDLLLRLSALTGEDRYRNVASAALRGMHDYMARYPGAVGQWLCALDFYLSTPREIALVGPLEDARMRDLLATVHGRYLPNKVLVAARPEELGEMEDLPLMDGRAMVHGLPTAFVCENFVCRLPVTSPEALAAQLEAEGQAPLPDTPEGALGDRTL